MLLSIEYNSKENKSMRRGFSHTIYRAANVLYGMYSKIDAEFIFSKVLASETQNINLILERTKIVKVEIDHLIIQIPQHTTLIGTRRKPPIITRID